MQAEKCANCEQCNSKFIPVSRKDYLLFKDCEEEINSIKSHKGAYYEKYIQDRLLIRYLRKLSNNTYVGLKLACKKLESDMAENECSADDIFDEMSGYQKISEIRAKLVTYPDKMLSIIYLLEKATDTKLDEVLRLLKEETEDERTIEEKYGAGIDSELFEFD